LRIDAKDSSCLANLLDRPQKFQQIGIDLILVCGRETVRLARVVYFPSPPLMSFADFFDEIVIGTIWSSSLCMSRTHENLLLEFLLNNLSQFEVLLGGHQNRSPFLLHKERDELRRFGLACVPANETSFGRVATFIATVASHF